MIINHNIAALNTYRALTNNNVVANKSLEKLSSGLRINRAGDDAAGLAISEKMRGQIRGLNQAVRNSQDAISLIQTAEGALNETHSILQRMRELAVQATNDTNTDSDRNEIQKEIDQLISEINRIADTTQFNTKVLMRGAYGTTGSSTDSNKVAVISARDDSITEGSYTVKITQEATKAITTGAQDLSTGVTITAGVNDILVLNGVTIQFAAGNYTLDQIVNKINEYQNQTSLVASKSTDNKNLILTELRYGARTNSYSGNAVSTLLGSATNTAGVNAAISDGTTAYNVVADENDGRKLTIQSGALKGLVLSALGATNDQVTVTIAKSSLTMQIGANEDQTFSISLQNMSASALGVSDIEVTSASKATSAITTIDTAIGWVSAERAKLGAYQNRLEHTIANLGTAAENLTAAESRIRDVDMAKEMMEFTKMSILQQAATAMLAQANMQPQMVLQLLGR